MFQPSAKRHDASDCLGREDLAAADGSADGGVRGLGRKNQGLAMSGHQNDLKNLTVLVIFFVANWKIHHFLDRSIIMCESSINGPLSIAMLNSQRVGLRQSIYVSFRRILLTGMLGFGCMNHQQLGKSL